MRPDVVNWLDQFLPREVALSIAPSWFMCVGLSGLVMLVWMVLSAKKRSIDTGVVANAVLWLCSDDASFVIGHALSVDGGYVLP